MLSLIAVMAMSDLYAQTNTEAYYRTHPVWISMMDQESVNYAEAVKAFNLFWEQKETPLEEETLFSAEDREKQGKDFISGSKKQTVDAMTYRFEYKKFKYWQQDVAAFVKDDGFLMSKEEQIERWKLQHNNRK